MAIKLNENLKKIENEDSFFKASQKVKEYKEKHPNNKVVSLGIGDVSFPVPKYIAKEMAKAIKKETTSEYVGYGNYYGIPELRKAIKDNEYPMFSEEEIYVSDGTKTDCGNILEMLDDNITIGIPNPTYPIYVNSCYSLSKKFVQIACDKDFKPIVPDKHLDVIYLCSPNNPVGITYSKEELEKWVKYAVKENALIIYDNVYFKFIQSGVKSIYEIKGAEKCAIELRSFSKHASFTGIRCSYYVVPNKLSKDINKLWRQRTINRFNGASYIAQVGALASFDPKAQSEINKNIKCYLDNASYLRKSFLSLGYEVHGGENAPYLWIKCKNGLTGWETFDLFLQKLEIVIVPGSIFGTKGKNYFRVSALGKRKDIEEAVERIKKYEEVR